MNYEEAKQKADDVLVALKPYCERIEIAGSIRRRKQMDIKDIEICLIPDNTALPILRHLINHTWGTPSIGKWPSKYTKIRGLKDIDIFTATKTNWGMLFFIRTGPADYVASALAHWKKISNGGYSESCLLHDADSHVVQTPEEIDVFSMLRWQWLDPEKRF